MTGIARHLALFLLTAALLATQRPLQAKENSSLYPPGIVQRMQTNAASDPWAMQVRASVVASAQLWRDMSLDELWALMFGPNIKRSWMVWSNGRCPACDGDVPMYNWKIRAMQEPWKLACPHCEERFPKNDFAAFHASGLDARGFFDPALADRGLLFNTGHPDPGDPLHLFGVDDGDGYGAPEGEGRWRFISAYLIYGQFKQRILLGIQALSTAYVLTGEVDYARRAGVMLDRVADIYSEFDFRTQSFMYDTPAESNGYISVWHDACEETREMVMAYDRIYDGIKNDTGLVTFLSGKAREYGMANPKATFEDIRRNIEDRILRDTLNNVPKIRSNYPRTDACLALIHRVLGGEENEAAFWDIVNPMIEKATAVDGVTGEKGMAGYTAGATQNLAMFLGEFTKADPAFLPKLVARYPRLKETWRFHIDTWCLQRYYPLTGDTGYFAGPMDHYVGMGFPGASLNIANYGLSQSSYSLLWQLYAITNDPAYVQVMYQMNQRTVEGLPYDLYAQDPAAFRSEVRAVIDSHGADIALGSVNKKEWHLALLRSGAPDNERVLWLDYDSGGGHGHADGMNLGLFAYGLDLLPDFGYPPVQFGGWASPRARWYTLSAAHNTAVVDGANTARGDGETTLWGEGRQVHVIRAAGAAINGGNRYERTAALIDLDDGGFYVADVFRLAGGSDHTLFMQTHFGTPEVSGLTLEPTEDFGHDTQMRNTRLDPAAPDTWYADWQLEDRYQLLAGSAPPRLRYTSLTPGLEAGLTEGFIVAGIYDSNAEDWIPRLRLSKKAENSESLQSTFASVIQPYPSGASPLAVERLDLMQDDGQAASDNHVAMLLRSDEGGADVLILRDPEATACTALATQGRNEDLPGVTTDAEFALVRWSAANEITYAALANGSRLEAGAFSVTLPTTQAFAEFTAPAAP